MFACCLALSSSAGVAANRVEKECNGSKPLIFGFLPLVSSGKLVQRFAPLVNYISDKIQRPVYIETAPDFIRFTDRTVHERRYDLLFTAPHFYYQAHNMAGYRLLVRVDSPGMVALIVVPVNSNIKTESDLRGRKLATVHPLGLATLLARKYLVEHNIDPDRDLTLVSTPSHNASLLSSYYGVTDASILMMPPFRAANRDVREGMRIIAKSERSPHMPVSAAPWLDEVCANKIARILQTMRDSEAGRDVLKKTRFPGFVNASETDYENLQWAAEQIRAE